MRISDGGAGDVPRPLPAPDGGNGNPGVAASWGAPAAPTAIIIESGSPESRITLLLSSREPGCVEATLTDLHHIDQLNSAAEDAVVERLRTLGLDAGTLKLLNIVLPDAHRNDLALTLEDTQCGRFGLNVVEKLGFVGQCGMEAEPQAQLTIALAPPVSVREMLEQLRQETHGAVTGGLASAEAARAALARADEAYVQAGQTLQPWLTSALSQRLATLFGDDAAALAARLDDWMGHHFDDFAAAFLGAGGAAFGGPGRHAPSPPEGAASAFRRMIFDVAPGIAQQARAQAADRVQALQAACEAQRQARAQLAEHDERTARLALLEQALERFDAAEREYAAAGRTDARVLDQPAGRLALAMFHDVVFRSLASQLRNGTTVLPLCVGAGRHCFALFQGATARREHSGLFESVWSPSEVVRIEGDFDAGEKTLQLRCTTHPRPGGDIEDAARIFQHWSVESAVEDLVRRFGSTVERIDCTLSGDAGGCPEFVVRPKRAALEEPAYLAQLREGHERSLLGQALARLGFALAKVDVRSDALWIRRSWP